MIPTIDISHVNTGTKQRREIGEQIVAAFKDTGFCKVIGHQIAPASLRNVYGVMNEFFNMPEDLKAMFRKDQIGYFQFGSEHAKDNQIPDLKEFFHVMNGFDFQNPYPSDEFRWAATSLFYEMTCAAEDILEAIDEVLDTEHMLSTIGGNTVMRLLHYPALKDVVVPPGAIRSSAHEDINLITLLPASAEPGLQLLQKDGTWLDVEAAPGEVIVNVGDMLQLATGGTLKSTTHRVVNPSGDSSARMSIPFFVHPRSNVMLTKDISARQYLDQRLKEIGLK